MQQNKTKAYRPDHGVGHRGEYDRNRRKILLTQDVCGICGLPVDKNLPYPHPMSATVDHIIPVSLGGHPSDINNLQLAHFRCNTQKGQALKRRSEQAERSNEPEYEGDPNNDLPQSMDWSKYRPGQF